MNPIKKYYWTIFLIFIFTVPSFGQIDSFEAHYKPLKLGDKLPDFQLINLVNYPSHTAPLSTFKGKLLILDFWAQHCASCIESWPKLLALQNEFRDKIQIILVNSFENETIVRKFIERRERIFHVDMTLPSVCGDTKIQELFPHESIPHVIWIDKDGTVKAITDGTPINAKNIEEYIENGNISMAQKIDNKDLIRVNDHAPLFLDGNGGYPKKIYGQSVFAKANDSLSFNAGLSADSVGGYSVLCASMAIKDLYSLAYSKRVGPIYSGGKDVLWRLLPNRVLLEMKDTTKYVAWVNHELHRQYLYTYQFLSKPTTQEKIQEMMQSDLKRYIGLDVYWEKRKMKCLVLTAEDTSLINYKTGKVQFAVVQNLNLNKVTISYFILGLENFVSAYGNSPYPIVDETNYRGLLGDISADINTSDFLILDKALQKYKMHLTLENREIDVLILKEPQGYIFPL
jgi:thiol-disulfide isomerase/thioredoxin